jgi:hypothetical protein
VEANHDGQLVIDRRVKCDVMMAQGEFKVCRGVLARADWRSRPANRNVRINSGVGQNYSKRKMKHCKRFNKEPAKYSSYLPFLICQLSLLSPRYVIKF